MKAAAIAGLLAIVALLALGSYRFLSHSTTESSSSQDLEALPYFSTVPSSDERSGVIVNDPSQTQPGLNLISFTGGREAFLLDNAGKVVHRWKPEVETNFGHVEPTRDGGLVIELYDDQKKSSVALVRIERDSSIRWRTKGRFHHDVDVLDDESLVSIDKADVPVSVQGRSIPILADFIVFLDPSGNVVERIPVLDLVGELIPAEHFERLAESATGKAPPPEPGVFPDPPFDFFHTNSVEVLRNDVPGLGHAGQILVSIRNLSLIVVFDRKDKEIVWSWGPGELSWQHDPTVLDNGHLLIFDNGTSRGRSRVIELDPVTREIVWIYDPPDGSFFSAARGSNQRLANGNTLIADSENGRAVEVTPLGQIVWEYLSDRNGSARYALYRVRRLEGAFAASFETDDAGVP